MTAPKIHIIICSWNRPTGIKRLLEQFNHQTFKDFRVTITNNNIVYNDILDSYSESIPINYVLHIIHNNENRGVRERFVVARETESEYCVFLDDDQIIKPTLLEEMIRVAEKNTLSAWWGFVYNGKYMNRSRQLNGNLCNHCGPGGLIVDSNIFKFQPFWDNWNEKYYNVDDVYISQFSQAIGWKLRGYAFPIEFDQSMTADANALSVDPKIMALKDEAIIYYKTHNWGISQLNKGVHVNHTHDIKIIYYANNNTHAKELLSRNKHKFTNVEIKGTDMYDTYQIVMTNNSVVQSSQAVDIINKILST